MANKITLKQTIASNPTTIRGQSCNLTASPDGKYLLYPSGQNIIMRDIDNPNECKVMAEHGKRCTVARYSPNGQWVASADEAGKIKIWTPFQEDDLVYKLKYEWHYLAGEIKDLAWCGENKRIVVAGDGQGNCANAFMFDTGSKLGDFVGISKRLNSCDIRKQKPFKTLVGGDDFSSVFYEGPPVKFIKTNKSFDKYVTCVRFNNAGDKYAAAGANGKIFVYDGETADNPVELTAAGAHSAGCYAVCWSPDDSKLVSCSADKTVKIWDMSSMSEIASISVGSNLGDQQLGVVWAPNGQIISVSLDGSLNYIQFDGNSASLSKKILGHSNSISCIDKLADGTLVAGSGFSNECYNYSTNFDAQKMTDGHKEKACLVSCHARQDHGFMTIAIDNSIKFGQSDYTGDESEVSARPEASDSCAETGQTVIACNESLALMLNKDVVDEVKLSYKPSCVAINQAFLGSWKRPFAMFRFFKKTVSQCFFRNVERSEAKFFFDGFHQNIPKNGLIND